MLAIFGLWDYVIFGFTLICSALIGLYFGCFGTKQKTTSEYLYGNGHMKAIPVGLSLYSSAISAITIIGTPSEVYVFGTQFLMVAFGSLVSLALTWTLVLPIFCNRAINMKMPYEYFELRFDGRVRTMSSLIYIIHVVVYMPVVLYASTLSFSDLSGLPLLPCTTLVGGVCVMYTMIGGFNSVIWTDTLQATLMLCSCIIVAVMGVSKIGGFANVWEIGQAGGRITFFDMNPDPFHRTTLWSTVFGMAFIFAAHSGCSASSLQRYMSLRTERDAKISSFIGAIGFTIMTLITGVMGMCMYALYYNCDPEQNKDIESSNQLVPYFISDTIGTIPGFAGFFIAGLLSAGLSTLSAEFNTVAGLMYHDFIKKFYRKSISDAKGAIIMKLCVLVIGVSCLLCIPIFQKSKHIFQFALMLGGLTYGAKLGILLLGTTFPTANSTGVLWGTALSMIVTCWLSFGALYYNVNTPYVLPTSVDGCQNATNSNVTILNNLIYFNKTSATIPEDTSVSFIYRISYLHYAFVGMMVAIIVGLLVSYCTKPDDKKLDPKLIVPMMHRFIPIRKMTDDGAMKLMLGKENDQK